jgi:hypothetical protein
MLVLSTLALAALGAALRGYFKYRFGVAALKDVPPDQRAEVVRAVGDAWRGWQPVELRTRREASDDTAPSLRSA